MRGLAAMPILDHFFSPLHAEDWPGVQTCWLASLAGNLNRRWLPSDYRAGVERYHGPEYAFDVLVVREPQPSYTPGLSGSQDDFNFPACDAVVPGVVAPHGRVTVRRAGGELVAVIEIVSPGNKDRREAREGFAGKVRACLQAGIALMVADIVTEYRFNLHNLWAGGEPCDTPRLSDPQKPLNVTAYRPVVPEDGSFRSRVEMWLRPLEVGDELPTLPLCIREDLAVPVELERTYSEACEDLRLARAAARAAA